MNQQILLETVKKIATRGKGILAADESTSTIKKRFDSIQIESTEESRRAYRDLLFSTPDINNFISGVIFYEETLFQTAKDGMTFPKYLAQKGMLTGIKVDKGLIDLPFTNQEKTTEGLDGLAQRLQEYKKAGASFAKWRCVYTISDSKPSLVAITTNAVLLARYAAICQDNGIVPIVEPEVLIDGNHTLEQCYEVTTKVLEAVFSQLEIHHVMLEGIILKPSMAISGKDCSQQASAQQVAEATVQMLKNTVPAAVPTINFLSGGQTSEQATLHLDLMNKSGELPWNLSFSYGRALQDHALKTWHGKAENVAEAQKAFYKRARLNSLAAIGEYNPALEQE